MLKNKKASIFWTLYLLIVLVMTVSYSILILSKDAKSSEDPTGENALLILKSIEDSEKLKINLEQSLKLATYSALKELGENQGYIEKKNQLWNLETENPNLKESFKILIEKNIKPYIEKLSPELKYHIILEENKIKLIPIEPLQIKTDTPEINLIYYSNPTVEIEDDYSDILKELRLEAVKLDICIRNQGSSIDSCLITSKIGKYGIKGFGRIDFTNIPLTTNIYTAAPISIKFSIETK